MRKVNVATADVSLAELVDDALAGEEVVLEREGLPVVRLVAIETDRKPRERRFGRLRGLVQMDDRFNDPLPEEIMRAFRGEDP